MTAVFADTFYWIALLDSADRAHRRAMELASQFGGSVSIVTTDEVLAEYLTFFAMAHEQVRRRAFTNAQRVLKHSEVRVIPQSHDSFLFGSALYGARPDKGYSLINCISMETMRREGLTEVLTNDRHFRAGRVPRTVPRLLTLSVFPALSDRNQGCIRASSTATKSKGCTNQPTALGSGSTLPTGETDR